MRHGEAGARATVRAGHWTDPVARTGCTVVLFDRPVLAAVDVRGGAPGTRETDVLAPAHPRRRADAILLTGGSAFGLAAADGVVRYLAALGRGFPTPAGPVPIVPAAVVYDLATGTPTAPDAASGEAACQATVPLDELPRGLVGAGTGATTGNITGSPEPGGLGVGRAATDAGAMTAIAVVNAFGQVAVAPSAADDPRERFARTAPTERPIGQATTLVVLVADGPCDHTTLQRCAIAAHDGLARSIRPCHTVFDGDTVFATTLLADQATPADLILRWSLAAELAVERAVLDATTARWDRS